MQLGIARAFELQRLRQILELQRAHERAIDRHLSLDVLQFHVRPAARRSILPFDIDGANHFAASDFQARIAADARDAHVRAIRHQFDVALQVARFEVAAARRALQSVMPRGTVTSRSSETR